VAPGARRCHEKRTRAPGRLKVGGLVRVRRRLSHARPFRNWSRSSSAGSPSAPHDIRASALRARRRRRPTPRERATSPPKPPLPTPPSPRSRRSGGRSRRVSRGSVGKVPIRASRFFFFLWPLVTRRLEAYRCVESKFTTEGRPHRHTHMTYARTRKNSHVPSGVERRLNMTSKSEAEATTRGDGYGSSRRSPRRP
jgi:hypothetical protein